MSEFIASQNEAWFDHDFFEAGYSDAEGGGEEKFKHYSYAEQWVQAVEDKASLLGMEEPNAFIMMGIDEPPRGKRYLQVSDPCSYKSEGIELVYVGEFSYVHDYSWKEK